MWLCGWGHSARALVAALCLAWSFSGIADSLPEPLDLQAALDLADSAHPDLREAHASLALNQARRLEADAGDDPLVTVEGRVRWIDPPDNTLDSSRDDHSLAFRASKPLYDFGLTRARQNAAAAEVAGSERDLLTARIQRRLDILDRFFDVLLADLTYTRDNEAMATEFVQLDRLRDRHELGQVSDVDLLARETSYQEAFRRRTASAARQRLSRERLAQALNRADDVPSDLVPPSLPGSRRTIPDVDELQALAQRKNPALQALRAQLHAARERVRVARAFYNPVVSGEVEAFGYTHERSSNDRWRAGLRLEVPLYTGGRANAEVAKRLAETEARSAALARQELVVREQVLELWLRLETLMVQSKEAELRGEYRELSLDRSRALYEMEEQADLGDAMVQTSEARLREAETRFALASVWARLDALTGASPETLVRNLLQGPPPDGAPDTEGGAP